MLQCQEFARQVFPNQMVGEYAVVALPLYHIFSFTACALLGMNMGFTGVLIPNPRDLDSFVKELAKRQPLRAVFRDDGFASDAVKINVEQIFKQMSPTTEVKSI